MIPTSIDGTDITGATIDGTDVQEITVDGDTVFTASDIPDSANLHARYDFSNLSLGTTTNVPDETGNGHDLVNGSFSGVSVSINGVQAGQFDGANDLIGSNTFTALSQPHEIFVLAELDTNNTTTFNYLFGSGSGIGQAEDIAFRTDSSEWFVFAGNLINGSNNTGANILSFVADGSNSILREDGSQTASGNAGGREMDLIGLGGRFRDGDRYFPGKIGEVLIYVNRDDQRRPDVESYLANKWGVTI